MTPRRFRELVFRHWKREGRHDLPWRATADPYRILVSEVMLQQTQVERVIPYHRDFLKKFPTVRKLAEAPLGDVLVAWQGLGYNRRAKMLHEAAKTVMREHRGRMPRDIASLESLPGVGPYTARAVAAFSSNTDSIFIETNIRTAVIHHYFPKEKQVADARVLEALARAYPKGRAREWYSALMDYGASLKKSGVKLNARAKGYVKQKPLRGSDREARGAILRALAKGAQAEGVLLGILGDDRREQLERSLEKLEAEGMIAKKGRRYRLP